jgi:hypothetical protein
MQIALHAAGFNMNICIFIYVFSHRYMYIRKHMFMYVCMYMYVFTHVPIRIYEYTVYYML